MARRLSIVIIGSGNVATHLARRLDCVHLVKQVYSRHLMNAEKLASSLSDCQGIDNAGKIIKDADLYLISVSDDSISQIAPLLKDVDGVVAHTSGSVGIEVLADAGKAQGVFYPLQTFSKHAFVDVSKVPFFIEGSSNEVSRILADVARGISDKVYFADSSQRSTLHIAAVYGCNFVNHLLDISSGILAKAGYELEVLRPLLEVTLEKAMSMPPSLAQTGPAVRRDINVIKKHLSRVSGYDREVYEVMTKSIMERRND